MVKKIKNWFKNNDKTIIRVSYIIPIIFVAGVSIAHVISWYSLTNPLKWSVYLSVGIEIAALSALAGMSTKLNKAIYLPFGIVTFIQFIGNMFFAFQYIDVESELFKEWVLLVGPIFDSLSMSSIDDINSHRRWLAIFGGALLPLISLSFLHLIVKFNDVETDDIIESDEPTEEKLIEEVDDTKTDDIDEEGFYTSTSTGSTVVDDINLDVEEEPIYTGETKPIIESEEIKPEEMGEPFTASTINEEISNDVVEPIKKPMVKKKPTTPNLIERVGTNKMIKDSNNNKVFYKKRN